jgi:hypothetical protein
MTVSRMYSFLGKVSLSKTGRSLKHFEKRSKELIEALHNMHYAVSPFETGAARANLYICRICCAKPAVLFGSSKLREVKIATGPLCITTTLWPAQPGARAVRLRVLRPGGHDGVRRRVWMRRPVPQQADRIEAAKVDRPPR